MKNGVPYVFKTSTSIALAYLWQEDQPELWAKSK